MKRIIKIFSSLLAVAIVSCAVFASSASAAAAYPDITTVSGYKGILGITGSGSCFHKGDYARFTIETSEGDSQNISNLNVTWSVADPTQANILDDGYIGCYNHYQARIVILKGGVTIPVYATVNGKKIEEDLNVLDDADPVAYSDYMTVSGQTGQIWLTCRPNLGDDGFYRGNTYRISVDGTFFDGDISKYSIAWSTDDSSKAAIIKNDGYSSSDKKLYAEMTVLKPNTTFHVFAKVNGTMLERQCNVSPDYNGIDPDQMTVFGRFYAIPDTTGNFTVKQNEIYTIMVRCNNLPIVAEGSNCFKSISETNNGDKHYYKFRAIGKHGSVCGFYLDNGNIPFAVATIN
ncbi:hypothetical protein A7X67_17320 [Clostridium sp. W14A]|nr:hypothetical protein A7X67_17320 [Clostridium sp. W14A]